MVQSEGVTNWGACDVVRSLALVCTLANHKKSTRWLRIGVLRTLRGDHAVGFEYLFPTPVGLMTWITTTDEELSQRNYDSYLALFFQHMTLLSAHPSAEGVDVQKLWSPTSVGASCRLLRAEHPSPGFKHRLAFAVPLVLTQAGECAGRGSPPPSRPGVCEADSGGKAPSS